MAPYFVIFMHEFFLANYVWYTSKDDFVCFHVVTWQIKFCKHGRYCTIRGQYHKIEVCNCIHCKADSFVPAIGTSVRNITTLLSFSHWNQIPRLQPLLCNTFSFNLFTFLAFLSSLSRSSNNWMACFHLLNSYWLMHAKIQQKKIKDEKHNDLCFCFFLFCHNWQNREDFLHLPPVCCKRQNAPVMSFHVLFYACQKNCTFFATNYCKWNLSFFSNTLNS